MRLDALEELRKHAQVDRQDADRKRPVETSALGTVLNAFVSDDEESEEEEDDPIEQAGPPRFIRIEADAAVREVTAEWSNGRAGIFKVSKDGKIDKAVVREKDGSRNTSLSRRAIGRVEELVRRLQQ